MSNQKMKPRGTRWRNTFLSLFEFSKNTFFAKPPKLQWMLWYWLSRCTTNPHSRGKNAVAHHDLNVSIKISTWQIWVFFKHCRQTKKTIKPWQCKSECGDNQWELQKIIGKSRRRPPGYHKWKCSSYKSCWGQRETEKNLIENRCKQIIKYFPNGM